MEQVREAVAQDYQRRAIPSPQWDPELARIAADIAESPEPLLGGTLVLRARFQARGLGDPAPSGLLLEAGSNDELLAELRRRLSPGLEPATLFGAGLATPDGHRLRLVILRVRRKAEVAPIPRVLALGEAIHLQGRLLGALKDPSCYAETPDGTVTQLRTRTDGALFEAGIEPRAPGRYVLEVMAEGSGGPEIAWIDQVWVGEPPRGAPSWAARPPDPWITPEEQVLRAINADRARRGEPSLALDPRLSELARAYGQELAGANLLVHRSPQSGDLVSRLQRAQYGFQRAGENLGQGPTPMEAHDLIAASPAHRRNLIDPNFDRCGIGIGRGQQPGVGSVVLVEIFAGGEPKR
jgi:hypothetical protein